MSKFFVGQHVVLIDPVRPENEGLEGVIVALGKFPVGSPTSSGPLSYEADCLVNLERFGICFALTSQFVCKCQS